MSDFSKTKGHLAIFSANVIFGLGVPVTKLLLDDWVTPMGYMASRCVFAALIFWVIACFLPKEHVEKRDLVVILLGGLLGFVISQTLTAEALDYTTPVYFSLVAALTPVSVMILAAIFLKAEFFQKIPARPVLRKMAAVDIIRAAFPEEIRDIRFQGLLHVSPAPVRQKDRKGQGPALRGKARRQFRRQFGIRVQQEPGHPARILFRHGPGARQAEEPPEDLRRDSLIHFGRKPVHHAQRPVPDPFGKGAFVRLPHRPDQQSVTFHLLFPIRVLPERVISLIR